MTSKFWAFKTIVLFESVKILFPVVSADPFLVRNVPFLVILSVVWVGIDILRLVSGGVVQHPPRIQRDNRAGNPNTTLIC